MEKQNKLTRIQYKAAELDVLDSVIKVVKALSNEYIAKAKKYDEEPEWPEAAFHADLERCKAQCCNDVINLIESKI